MENSAWENVGFLLRLYATSIINYKTEIMLAVHITDIMANGSLNDKRTTHLFEL